MSCHVMHRVANLKKPGNKHKAQVLWSMRDVKTNADACYDRSSERQVENRTSVPQALWGGAYEKPDSCVGRSFKTNGSSMAESSDA